MRKVTTRAVYDMESGALLSWEGYWVDEQVVCFQELKKGRETVEQNAASAQKQAGVNNANSNAAFGTADAAYKQDLGSSTPGSLTPAATAQLASDTQNIGRVYNGMRQNAFATMGQRGMGNAPSGFGVAAKNGLDQGQAGSETDAYRNAQVNTQNQRNFATTGEANLSGQQGSLGVSNTGQSTDAAYKRSQMGSTLGDIGQGISTAAGIAGSVMGMPGVMGGPTSGSFSGGSPGALFSSIGQNNSNIAGMNTYMKPPGWQPSSGVGGY